MKGVKKMIREMRRYITIDATERICANCVNFVQHFYKKGAYEYDLVNAGHCTEPRVKDRSPCNKACEKFENVYEEVIQIQA